MFTHLEGAYVQVSLQMKIAECSTMAWRYKKSFSLAFIAISALIAIMALFRSQLADVRGYRLSLLCANRLRSIGKRLETYVRSYGDFPRDSRRELDYERLANIAVRGVQGNDLECSCCTLSRYRGRMWDGFVWAHDLSTKQVQQMSGGEAPSIILLCHNVGNLHKVNGMTIVPLLLSNGTVVTPNVDGAKYTRWLAAKFRRGDLSVTAFEEMTGCRLVE